MTCFLLNFILLPCQNISSQPSNLHINDYLPNSVSSCRSFSKCSECITNTCGWCNHYCDEITKCQSEICNPVIDSFSPKGGYFETTTNLTIRGDNLGSSKCINKTEVTITGQGGLVHCPTYFISPVKVKCTLNSNVTINSPSMKTLEGDVEVNVDNCSHTNYIMNGSVKAKEKFVFAEPNFSQLSPNFGPMSGKVMINIYGSNLNLLNSKPNISIIDSNNQVLTTCEIKSINSDLITCQPSECCGANKKAPINGKFIFSYNSKSYYTDFNFTFKSEPSLESTYPEYMTFSHQQPIILRGHHFDSIAFPRIQFGRLNVKCEKFYIDEVLSCTLPNLTESWFDGRIIEIVFFNDQVLIRRSLFSVKLDPDRNSNSVVLTILIVVILIFVCYFLYTRYHLATSKRLKRCKLIYFTNLFIFIDHFIFSCFYKWTKFRKYNFNFRRQCYFK